MSDKNRLIELIIKCDKDNEVLECFQKRPKKRQSAEIIADHLLANGVIVPPCKVGDMVYILKEKCKFSGEKNEPRNSCKQYWDNVFKNKMWGCAGKDKEGNYISCKKKEMVWYAEETEYSLLFYSNPTIVFGKNYSSPKRKQKQNYEREVKIMREILFRGKDIANNWHYGVPLIFTEDYVCITAPHTYNKTVIPDTIGQYTGLTDKNGTKIFEGDIVKHDFGADQIGVQYAVVEYDLKYASFMIKPIYDWMFCDKDDCEVIGNIHDNPELVKECEGK